MTSCENVTNSFTYSYRVCTYVKSDVHVSHTHMRHTKNIKPHRFSIITTWSVSTSLVKFNHDSHFPRCIAGFNIGSKQVWPLNFRPCVLAQKSFDVKEF